METEREICQEGHACEICNQDAWHKIATNETTFYMCSNISCIKTIEQIVENINDGWRYLNVVT